VSAPVAEAAVAEAAPENGEVDLEKLRAALASASDDFARSAVIDDIADLGQKARGALDVLVEATGDKEPRTRWHAARAIGFIGEDALRAMPTLLKLLGDSDPIVATQAAAAIGCIRRDDPRTGDALPAADAAAYAAATTALADTMMHKDARVRRASLRTLQNLKPAPELLARLVSRHLADADPSVVLPALHTMADMGAGAVPFLLEALKNPLSHYWATVALTEIGPAAKPAVELLTQGMAEGGTEERMQSILALAAIGEPTAESTAALVQALESGEGPLRFAAAYALGRMRAAQADAALERAAEDSDPFLASVAAWARARIHPDDKALLEKAIGRLGRELASDQPNVRSGSVSALSDLAGSLDPDGARALAGAFAPLLGDADPGVRSAAAAALVRLREHALDVLEGMLADPGKKAFAMELLAAIGPAAKPATDSLMAALADGDPAIAGDAAVAIAAIGPDAAAAVPELRKIIDADGVPTGLRYSAAYALGRIGPAAKPAAARLRELAASDDELLATVATWATMKVEPEDRSLFDSAVPLLRKAIRGERELVRLEAAVALGDIGAAAVKAIPILELVSEEDPSSSVRSAAAAALAKIRAESGK